MRICLLIACLATLLGCATVEPAEPLAANERYYCRPGSMLKYKRPAGSSFGGYWVPMPIGGSCKGY